MNECTTLGLIYGLFSFSQSIPDRNFRTTGGYYYIGLIVKNILTHIFFIILSSCLSVKLRCKKCANIRAS